MRSSDWSSDVCSSDLCTGSRRNGAPRKYPTTKSELARSGNRSLDERKTHPTERISGHGIDHTLPVARRRRERRDIAHASDVIADAAGADSAWRGDRPVDLLPRRTRSRAVPAAFPAAAAVSGRLAYS